MVFLLKECSSNTWERLHRGICVTIILRLNQGQSSLETLHQTTGSRIEELLAIVRLSWDEGSVQDANYAERRKMEGEWAEKIKKANMAATDIVTIGHIAIIVEAQLQRLCLLHLDWRQFLAIAHLHTYEQIQGRVKESTPLDNICKDFAPYLFWKGRVPRTLKQCRTSLRNWKRGLLQQKEYNDRVNRSTILLVEILNGQYRPKQDIMTELAKFRVTEKTLPPISASSLLQLRLMQDLHTYPDISKLSSAILAAAEETNVHCAATKICQIIVKRGNGTVILDRFMEHWQGTLTQTKRFPLSWVDMERFHGILRDGGKLEANRKSKKRKRSKKRNRSEGGDGDGSMMMRLSIRLCE